MPIVEDDPFSSSRKRHDFLEMASEMVIEHKAYARVGFLGNPSDVYFGRTISFSLANFWASVRLQPSDDFVIQPHPTHDLVRFDSFHHLVNRLENEGYYGGVRLLMSICKVFYKYCADKKIDLKGGNFTMSYETNIPRQWEIFDRGRRPFSSSRKRHEFLEMASEMVIEHKAYARVGFLGNPSDVYFGRTISFSLANFWASVRLQPSDDFVIQPHPTHDLVRFDSFHHLVNRLENEGYYGGVRLLMSICKVFYKYCADKKIDLKGGNFTMSYETNIPRQTGLSGSSAIVCAALNCFLDFFKVRHLVKVVDRPNLILNAENELGIVAGLQDRVAQVYGGLVFMDFSKKYMDDLGHGMYTPMDISLLPQLYIIYAENPSDSGKVHSSVRKRWLEGDKFIISSMEEVANVALEGCTALHEKDYTKLTNLMNHNFDLRRKMFGDDALGSLNIKMVEVARSIGAACKFTGSGGAVVAFCPNGLPQEKLLEEACKKAGFLIQPAVVVPSFLGKEDLKTLTD